MLHSKRLWSITPAENADCLAKQLTQYTWCGCSGFRLGNYVFVNDTTCADGAQEFGVLREQADGFIQIESLTFSWMAEKDARTIIRRVLAGEFDNEQYGMVDASRLQTPEQHGRCHQCA